MLNLLPLLVLISSTQTATPVVIKTPQLELELTPRTPNQMGSFYEARGFPKSMLNILKQQCYITVHIKNTSHTKIWLDLSQWHFSTNGKPLIREPRNTWQQRWQQLNIPLSKQSTFRWTLIPETLDYLPGEEEGGNLVLPFTNKAITLKANFKTGMNKETKEIKIFSEKIYCAEDN